MSKRDELNTDLSNINNDLSIVEAQKKIFGLRADELMDDERPEHPEGTLIAEPFPIMNIIPDITQPRKLIPSKIRSSWNGKPETIAGLLMNWHKQAQAIYEPIPIQKILDGKHLIKEDDLKEKDLPAIVEEFLAVVSLAASIKQDGLLNPITISETGSPRKLVAGERRYLAYQLLNMFYSDNFDKIPAFQKKFNVWDQAAENGARRPLNAIGTASQIALLLMDLYQGIDGADFQPYHQLVIGENEQPYYAQVKNGYVYPIKKEFAQRILDVTGLKSANQVTQYRRLLDLPADIWMKANEDNWTEFGIRTHLQELNKPDESDGSQTLIDDETLPHGKVSNDEPEESLTTVRLEDIIKRFGQQYVRLSNGTIGKVWRVETDGKLQVMPPGAKFALLVSHEDVESILNEAAYKALTNKPESPSPSMGTDLGRGEDTGGIKRFMLSKGVRIATKQGEILTIETPAFGGSDTYTCVANNGRRKNIDFKDIAAILTEEEHTDDDSPRHEEEGSGAEGFKVGQLVTTRTGQEGRVLGTNGRFISVATKNGIQDHYAETLTPGYSNAEVPTEETPETQTETEFIFEEFDNVLMPLFQLSQITDHPKTAEALTELRNMTLEELTELADAGTLGNIFQAHYDSICLMLESTKHHMFNILENVEQWASGEDGDDD